MQPRRGTLNPVPEPTRTERAAKAVTTAVSRNQFVTGFITGTVVQVAALVIFRIVG